ncbi:fimbria/pilus outer membrane usher protein [Cupriavidus agavae]|uniref:Outer membrane usher protein n=1 Tax=Cupriavidus agavae TaxID=1001822 RepID=A0A4Q7S4H0_9BURK|nr:fimbria/pilus outer membrane usher protein [Cupriavidus agavae]RZT41253.1 outer membrane usher protein [Cupriavidus agavae]
MTPLDTRPRRARLWWALASLLPAATALAQDNAEIQFHEELLRRSGGNRIDVTPFSRANAIVPGDYVTDIFVNGEWSGRETVRFEAGSAGVAPCITRSLATRMKLDLEALSPQGRAVLAGTGDGTCTPLAAVASDAGWSFNVNDLRLNLSVPQALLRRTPQGYVPPEFWDAGIPSATAGYTFNSYHTTGSYGGTTSFLGIDAGVNVGSWHLRQRSSMTWMPADRGGYDYQNIATYLQHDIPSWRSQLTLGDAFTDGAIFDSYSIRGLNLSSDDRMLPDSYRGYAPVVRGVARSNARVTITQNGNRLRETTVAPGPFEINDLYATGYGGELLVTVTEADGSSHTFTVPYASVVQLLRPGISRYSFTAGEYRNSRVTQSEKLMQATFQHGLSNLITGYGGLVYANSYQAGLVGMALNSPVGAFALDITQAHADVPGSADNTGQSYRASYSNVVPSTRTNITVAAYRYASSGFWQMGDAFLARSYANAENGPVVLRRRNQFQLTVNQRLPDGWGSLYATGSSLSYWDREGTANQFQIGYNNVARLFRLPFTYNLAASRLIDGTTGRLSTQVFAGFTVPLGRSPRAPMLSFGYTEDSANGDSQQLLVTGTALADSSLSYGIGGTRSNDTATGSGNVQYRSPYATLSASASAGEHTSQFSVGLQGALVAHSGGVTLANYVADTVAVVEAKSARGAHILNVPGVRVDRFGYAVVPYLVPYGLNTIEIDPRGMPADMEFRATSTQVVPRANSVVKVRFETLTGRSAIVVSRAPDGSALPFGATVSNEAGVDVGIVGQGGRIFVRGVEDSGRLVVRWGAPGLRQCQISYALPPHDTVLKRHVLVEAPCEPLDATVSGSAARRAVN